MWDIDYQNYLQLSDRIDLSPNFGVLKISKYKLR